MFSFSVYNISRQMRAVGENCKSGSVGLHVSLRCHVPKVDLSTWHEHGSFFRFKSTRVLLRRGGCQRPAMRHEGKMRTEHLRPLCYRRKARGVERTSPGRNAASVEFTEGCTASKMPPFFHFRSFGTENEVSGGWGKGVCFNWRRYAPKSRVSKRLELWERLYSKEAFFEW